MSRLTESSTQDEVLAVAQQFADEHGLKAEGLFADFVHPLNLIHEAGLDAEFEAYAYAA